MIDREIVAPLHSIPLVNLLTTRENIPLRAAFVISDLLVLALKGGMRIAC